MNELILTVDWAFGYPLDSVGEVWRVARVKSILISD